MNNKQSFPTWTVRCLHTSCFDKTISERASNDGVNTKQALFLGEKPQIISCLTYTDLICLTAETRTVDLINFRK